ncbi:hypothetical protein [Boseongicola sp. H5]|uniref:hypothetical protein n=1 Tax=Rhodobacterales TaxID=204455 RepID=UPI001B267283|nr:hypothetical protein [Boseongicola sp. H5]MBO6605143.1 hypothetical protein [Roseicyclus sp.]MBO6626303.1 hypothetical protein [Roseicyclus sp.]MBO6922656.1 hypothetical protein [Roseicyclus sp.]
MIRACLAALLLATPVAAPAAMAQTDRCSEQLVLSVEQRLPWLREGLDVRDLSCNGIVQVFFLLDEDPDRFGLHSAGQRQKIEAVFRREGLIR